MGELAVTKHVLTALGLGSCIGLALLDRRMGLAGLAHIVLPSAGDDAVDNPRKFADRAVPELVSELEARGARRVRLEAAMAGGASMFAAAGLEVGSRNEAAVREELREMRIPVVAAATGGSRGRTLRVDAASGTVTVREAGGRAEAIVPTTHRDPRWASLDGERGSARTTHRDPRWASLDGERGSA